MKTKLSALFLLSLMLRGGLAQEAKPPRAPEVASPKLTADPTDARMQWWREAKFGMFIHWGLYATPARGEWVMNKEHIPVAKYAKLADQFNPVKFNAEEWVRIAKDAGMKYIVITSKHHDGFAMFDSKTSPFNIVAATPFQRDPLKELAAACAKAGLQFGCYYSQAQDWSHPGGAVSRGGWDAAQQGDFVEYLHTKAIPQVKELLNNYHPAVIWFDTPVNMTPALAREINQAVRGIQPATIINSRLLVSGRQVETLDKAQQDELRAVGVNYLSYRDRQIPEHPLWRDWETCMTLNGAWGYTANDHNWKSPKTVVQMLVEAAGKGGNFLLNVGPTAAGVIPPESVTVLKQVGVWLHVNGEAIYGAEPCDLQGPAANGTQPEKAKSKAAQPKNAPPAKEEHRQFDWLATARSASPEKGQPAKIYLHLFQWPGSRFEVKGVTAQVAKAYLLSDAQRAPLKFSQQAGNFSVRLPETAPDAIATVICLETSIN